MGEQTETGFMCLTDFEFELFNASGGNVIYPSIEDIKARRKCVEGCGIVEVRVSYVRTVQPPSLEDDGSAA